MQGLTLDELRADHIKDHRGFVWQCEHCKQIWKEAKLIGGMMHTGMMWLDTSKDALGIKIAKAVEYYENKYGRKPDLVLMNPRMWDDGKPETFTLGNITVKPYRPVLPGHLWLGIEDKTETKA